MILNPKIGVLCAILPLCSFVSANPIISEFMAKNETTIRDDDGDFSDWIEIHNPTTEAIPMAGWKLADSNAQWTFPAVTLAPGEFLIVWASDKDRANPDAALHTDFKLSDNGEYLGLIQPDGSTVEQEFAPEYPPLQPDESFGPRFESTVLVADAATANYLAPSGPANPPATWRENSYDDSAWTGGLSGFGFGLSAPGISVRQVSKNGDVNDLPGALALLALPPSDPSVLSSVTVIRDTVNILIDGADGHYPGNDIAPSTETDDLVLEATGFVTIPTAGTYTFGLNSDDGGRIVINGTEIMRDDSSHAPQDNFGTIVLGAGTYPFEAVMFQGGGGACMEFFAASGSFTSFNASSFRLVGDVANGGLAATTSGAGGDLVGTDVSPAMSGKSGLYLRFPFSATAAPSATAMCLVINYDDGFTAWLNDTPLASANAPAQLAWNSTAATERAPGAALSRTGFSVGTGLGALSTGANTLAIHGLNSSVSDDTFVVRPELIVGNLLPASEPAFYAGGLATPGWINGETSSLGNVDDTQFSIDRGIFESPFSLEITTDTPDAVIRYTTDGSEPSATHGTIYNGPLTISATSTIRAIATLDGWMPTNIDTQTYLFPDDVIRQSANGSAPPGWPSSSGTSQVLDYGMDPQIVDHSNPDIGGPETIKSALLSLPSIALTTDLGNLFDINGSQGIYSNPGQRGFAWERPVSVEWIDPPDAENPTGKGEFQVDAGVRLRGGFSRSTANPKHSFRLFFRGEYGPTKLDYPVFGREGAQEFDQIDLRTSQNYSWSFQGDSQNTFLREEASRQAQLDMGNPGSHVRYLHLYINGHYWGLFNFDERTEAAFSETYFGGDKEEYDVVKAEQDDSYSTGATDGNLDAWQALWTKARAHQTSPTNANYFAMMGLAADGVTPTADPVLLDADNLIDYMLLTFWTGNLDGAVSNFLGNNKANNWFASRRRDNNPGEGFRFFVHDFEHSMFNTNEDRTGPFTETNRDSFRFSNPFFLHHDLIGNAEYKMRWADRAHRFLFNDGALTPTAWQNRVNKLAADVDLSIAAESARWGDAKRSNPRTRQDWINAQNSLLSYFIPRAPVIISQLRADGLYPDLDAPVISPAGGYQPQNTQVSIQGPATGTLYYMADGSDPRAIGGALRAGALTYSQGTTTTDLIPWSASGWSYQESGANLGTAWRTAGFDDSTWSTGKAQLGYGDGDEETVITPPDIDPGRNGVQKPATTYFRKSFSVADISTVTGLELKIAYDDAYVVYLNGSRIAGNLPNNPAYDYYTGSFIEETIDTVSVPATSLITGQNLIAVEIHQSSPSSSDISMDLSLKATEAVSETPLFLSGIGEQVLRVRTKDGATWSALAESIYQVGTAPPSQATLVVSEISYHPASPNGDAEFIELLNADPSATLDLSGAIFTRGIDFIFPTNTVLAPGGRILIVKNIAAFQSLHGSGKPIAGEFANDTALSNSGERLTLEAADGSTLLDFTYGTNFPWPAEADGFGRSMVLINPADPMNPLSWRLSTSNGGNPGTSDSIPLASGENLLDYALGENGITFDPASGDFSVTRRLGADAVEISAEWSTALGTWFTDPLTLVSETPDAFGNSTLTWRLSPLPPEKAFIRAKVSER